MNTTVAVTTILANDPSARSSDNKLILEVWERLGCEFTPEQRKAFVSMPSVGSIVRVRARIQASGRFRSQSRRKNTEVTR